jgi:hypothetical protein
MVLLLPVDVHAALLCTLLLLLPVDVHAALLLPCGL